MIYGLILGLSVRQFVLLLISYVVIVAVSERTLYKTRRENIAFLLAFYESQGMCDVCLERERARLNKLDAIDVERETYKIRKETGIGY